MRAPTALTAAALATATALLLTACGGGGGGSDDGDKIPGVATTAPSAPATTPAATGAPTIDPALALPADLKLNFDWQAPADHTQALVLSTTANFMQSLVHGVVKQSFAESGLQTYATDKALSYGKSYIKLRVDLKRTLTGTDRYYRPEVQIASNKTSAKVTFCENQAKLFSKEIPTGKVHVNAESVKSYAFYEIVLTKFRPTVDLWQAQSIVVKESAQQCKQ
ncbi:hypothetical protein [Streptomyces sp. SPB162]|uniref:hypothetical protein n=1 Tax=Streptomyces sp. SPB162 TaxID=2940560 RepID=UPI0024061133|nr:hypothetical protein [Streptomyces sp. SPB162]MDF9815494.1 hypothetical protein [Streptomyces sp. SPB162]